MRYNSDKLLLTADFAGTLVFAMEGASAAVRANLDLLGLMVLAFATALGGGIVRDLLIGAAPPQSLRDWRYAAVAFAGGALVFFLHPFVSATGGTIMVLDAAGLALFAVAGTEKALLYKMHPLIAMLMGTITGVGGGTVRDILLAQVPAVLRSDVYATAALAGSALMLLSRRIRISNNASAVLGGSACFLLRVVSVWKHWNLPKLG
ncbi:MAG: TRIC cation channel family protein [Acidobacteriales bacterium]|nr:TRIC cation channel family protein [Terriglobales bacterium]